MSAGTDSRGGKKGRSCGLIEGWLAMSDVHDRRGATYIRLAPVRKDKAATNTNALKVFTLYLLYSGLL
jgi:hypothetical protein